MKAKSKTPKPTKPTKPPYPRVYELFNDFGYELGRASSGVPAPSCGNGDVSIRRFRITVELIDEPKEVLADRLRMLWRRTRNHHDSDTLRSAAARLGIVLDRDEFGADVKRER